MNKFRFESIIIALGLFFLGLFIYWGLDAIAQGERVVSVRGLAEKEVKADHVIWPIVYETSHDDMMQLYNDINKKDEIIKNFLKENGINLNDLTVSAPDITDRLNYNSYNENKGKRKRFTGRSVLTISTKNVDAVIKLIPRMVELLKEGIVITKENYYDSIEFEFTSLNDIKPEMIEKATLNAREAAEKFASDSKSELGKIRNATQGLFSIESRDQYTPYIKNVRVVTSVEFFLES